MKFNIEEIKIEMPTMRYQANGMTHTIPGSGVNVNLTIHVPYYDVNQMTQENIMDMLREDTRIAPGAPSYQELLKKYHPEYIL